MTDRELERFLEEFRKEEAELEMSSIIGSSSKGRFTPKHRHRYDNPGAGPEGTWWGCECGKRIIGWN